VNVLSAKRPKKPTTGGYDTKPSLSEQVSPYVIEKVEGTRRLELLTSTVSNLGPESDGAIPKESK
jgi:hypothetical protein